MTKYSISRRGFLKLSLSIASLSMIERQVLGLPTDDEPSSESNNFVRAAFRLSRYENLLNLDIYFVSAEPRKIKYHRKSKKKDKYIQILGGNTGLYSQDEAYMIVRLPQQHISESYMNDANLAGDADLTKYQAQCMISGYSFLVFRLIQPINDNTFNIPLNYESLTDWNNPRFRLVVRQNLKHSIFDSNANSYPLGYADFDGSKRYNYNKFPRSEESSLDANPITTIEAPSRLLLSPLLPDQDQFEFYWLFSNKNLTQLRRHSSLHNTVDNELWMATLTIRTRRAPDFKYNKLETNPEMNVGVIAAVDRDTLRFPKALFESLPDANDKRDLEDLYIKYKLRANVDSLTFSPLGLTTKINFRNRLLAPDSTNSLNSSKSTDGPVTNSIPALIDWQQNIAFGRDEEVVVTNLWVDLETGLKMLVVRTTKRSTVAGNSILVYREYIQPLDRKKNFSNLDIQASELYDKGAYKANIPFKEIRFANLDRKQIVPLMEKPTVINKVYLNTELAVIDYSEDSDSPKQILAFWPLDFFSSEDIYFTCILTDWEGNEVSFEKRFFLVSKDFESPVDSDRANQIQKVFGSSARAELTEWKDSYISKESELENSILLAEGGLQGILKSDFYVFLNELESFKSLVLESRIELSKVHDSIKCRRKLREVLGEQISKFEAQLENSNGDDVSSVIGLYGAEQSALIMSHTINLLSAIDKFKYDDKFQYYRGALERSIESVRKLQEILLNGALDSLLRRISIVITSSAYASRSGILFQEFNRISHALSGLVQANAAIGRLESGIKNKWHLGCRLVTFVANSVENKSLTDRVEDNLDDAKNKIAGWYEPKRDILNRELARFETEYIIINARYKVVSKESKMFDFFDENSCFPQLHSAQVYSRAVSDLINYRIPISIRIAEKYYKNQANEFIFNLQENPSAVFAEVAGDSQQWIKSTLTKASQQFGGIISPSLPSQFITFLGKRKGDLDRELNRQIADISDRISDLASLPRLTKSEVDRIKTDLMERKKHLDQQVKNFAENTRDLENTVRQDLIFISQETHEAFSAAKDWGAEQFLSAKEFFSGLDSKILGSINLRDILGQGFDLPKFIRFKKNGKSYVSYHFVTDRFISLDMGLFSFNNFSSSQDGRKTDTSLAVYFERSIPSAPPVHGGSVVADEDFTSQTRLSNFQIGILQRRLVINFESLSINSSKTQDRKVDVRLGAITFSGELSFVDSLASAMSALTQLPGLKVLLHPKRIGVSYSFAIPNITGGVFNLSKLRFTVGVILPLSTTTKGMPISTSFAVGAIDDKFVVSAGIFGGRGYFNLVTTGKRLQRIETAIEFGGYLGINLGGIATGEVYLMAGVFFSYDYSEQKLILSGYLICGGTVSVFGFITVAVQFYVSLTYEQYQGQATLYGTASATYSIKIGFFRKSFSLTFSKRITGANSIGGDPANPSSSTNTPLTSRAIDSQFTTLYQEEEEDIFDEDIWAHFVNAFDKKGI
ncbi:hypothetical protein [Dyadobacter sp. OTU695]|uniref:hypothetical protein n=1 Tax=Dyadobacter sp. OTU695 TaxID=3043860 RepID=UPI00313D460E